MRLAPRVLAFVAPLALLAAAPGAASAQSYAQQVWDQLQRVYDIAAGEDYTLQNYIIGALNDDGTDSWTFPLDAGTSYLITGACDTDCSDLDIVVTDENGNTVAQDQTTDDIPVVQFTTRGSGRHTVEITMYACSANPCYFGFGIFER